MAVHSVRLKTYDSFDFETRHSNEDGIKYEDIRESNTRFDQIQPFLDRLPKREADLVELYFKEGKNQKDIAKMYGVTQGAISSRISRAIERCRFLSQIPKITEADLDIILKDHFEPIEVDIIKGMISTTCQSRTAFLINRRYGFVDEKKRMTQVKIRHRFEKCISYLELKSRKNPDLKNCYDLLLKVKENLYMLHEVRLPHFYKGECEVFSATV